MPIALLGRRQQSMRRLHCAASNYRAMHAWTFPPQRFATSKNPMTARTFSTHLGKREQRLVNGTRLAKPRFVGMRVGTRALGSAQVDEI